MTEREIKRKEMQNHLDAQKTQKDRNVMGQFSTPFPLALDIMKYMRKLLGTEDVSFVEPSSIIISSKSLKLWFRMLSTDSFKC